MSKITKDDIKNHSSSDLNINELAEKLTQEKNISVQEAKFQIEELTEPKMG